MREERKTVSAIEATWIDEEDYLVNPMGEAVSPRTPWHQEA
jgi:hypothetical protein